MCLARGYLLVTASMRFCRNFSEGWGGEEGGKDHPKDPYASKRTPVTLKDPLKTLFSQIRGQAHPRVTEVCSPRFGLPKGFFVPLIT